MKNEELEKMNCYENGQFDILLVNKLRNSNIV